MSLRAGQCTPTYIVKSGDTLYAIATTNGVTLAALEAANPQITNPDLIFPKQMITIPCPGGAGGAVPAGEASGK